MTVSALKLIIIGHDFFSLQPTKRERTRRKAMETMNRIGRELVNDRKAAVLGQKHVKSDVEDDRGELASRDLLSVLVQANLDTGLPANQRMSDEDVLDRTLLFMLFLKV